MDHVDSLGSPTQNVTSRLAEAASPRSATDALQSAAETASALIKDIINDLSHIEPRISIAFEVTELAPLVKTVKSVKTELGNCSSFVSLPGPTPVTVDPVDRLNYIKALLASEFAAISKVMNELSTVVPYVDNVQQMITAIRALKSIKVALNA